MATHAAYTTGKYTHGYVGLVYSRMEIGVPIFFVLSGFLLFGPWVKANATDGPRRRVRRYAWHRVRRIMPAYVITVLIAYAIYHFRTAGPNPGHTWMGLLRNLTLTQTYTDNYLYLVSASGPDPNVESGSGSRVLCGAAAAGVPAVGRVVPTAMAADPVDDRAAVPVPR